MQAITPKGGHTLAVLGTTMLLSGIAGLVLLFATTLFFTLGDTHVDVQPDTTPIPLITYLTWGVFVGGCTASVVAIALYGFRARWFWRCLVVAAIFWLLAPPAGTVVGIFALIVLIGSRKAFPMEDDSPLPHSA